MDTQISSLFDLTTALNHISFIAIFLHKLIEIWHYSSCKNIFELFFKYFIAATDRVSALQCELAVVKLRDRIVFLFKFGIIYNIIILINY